MWNVTVRLPSGEVKSTSHRMLHQTTWTVSYYLALLAKTGAAIDLTATPTLKTYQVRGKNALLTVEAI
jgi:hypothetical protein